MGCTLGGGQAEIGLSAAAAVGQEGDHVVHPGNIDGVDQRPAAALLGDQPGPAQFPDGHSPTAVFVADDNNGVAGAWTEIGPYVLHDARMAAAYRHGDESVASITRAETVDEIRAAASPYAVLTVDEAAGRIRGGASLPLHPLCGGMPPELAWPYLERAALAVSAARGGAA